MSAPRRDNAPQQRGEVGTYDSKFSPDTTPDKPKRQSKSESILSVLKSGVSLQRFTAETLGDHCLNSTVAELRSKGYQIHSEWISVPTRFGRHVRVKLYSYAGTAGNGEV